MHRRHLRAWHDESASTYLQYLSYSKFTWYACVVYSQSLFTLGLIEEYLAKQNVPGTEVMWMKNKNYFRMLLFVFTARRNARIASTVLAMAFPSVCPSVTRRYCVKTTAHSTVQFALSDSKMCLVL